LFKKIYFKTKLISAFLRQNFYFLIIGILVGSISFYALPLLKKTITSKQIKKEKIGIVGLYTKKNLPYSITSLISYGLTQTGHNNKIENSPLLEKWTVKNDNKNFILDINTNHYWHNGQKFKVQDINYQISGAKIEKINKKQIKISLQKPFSPLLSLLQQPLFKNSKKLIGLGHYQVKKIKYRGTYVKQILLYKKNNKKQQVQFSFYDNQSDLINAFKLGEVNTIQNVSSTKNIEQWPNVTITPKTSTNQSYVALFLNTKKLDNKSLRQALAYATPKESQQKNRCIGPISPNSWAYNENIKRYNYNPKRAKKLFEKNKIDQINITLNDPKLLPLAEKIKESWQKILDLKTNLSVSNQIDTNNFEVILTQGAIPVDPDQYLFWHSTQNTNLTKLNNPKIDKLLEQGRQSFDIQERKQIYLGFQRSLLEECPAIFLYYPITYTVSKK